ncbi:uncharacterized protein Pyn_00558 [Prunus yedoensis var. nudiflora]|uniref:Uncharacterized protein n=1 Tax=Prunus yedoensis var. nudiflora TaxID=2094558 RepID=A0A314V057_PRUYE|nr:uncharacterized protein Pyn_00558 [Prunus yedoensis var. nudiflora]
MSQVGELHGLIGIVGLPFLACEKLEWGGLRDHWHVRLETRECPDSLIQPVTKSLLGVAVITVLITLVLRDPPECGSKLNISGGNFPPWIIALVVRVFTRMRKRTRD